MDWRKYWSEIPKHVIARVRKHKGLLCYFLAIGTVQLQILQEHVCSSRRMLWPLLQRFCVFHFEVAFLDASLIAGSCKFRDYSPVLLLWYLPYLPSSAMVSGKISAQLLADVYQVYRLYSLGFYTMPSRGYFVFTRYFGVYEGASAEGLSQVEDCNMT